MPDEYIKRVFAVMLDCPQHIFIVLTKRSVRLLRLSAEIDWAPNIWMGVSVESAAYMERVDHLLATRAAIKFLHAEPLLGPLPNLPRGLDWVVVGGESGLGARPLDAQWVRDIRDQCVNSGVPFLFKQWGGVARRKAGCLLDGQTWSGMPRAR